MSQGNATWTGGERILARSADFLGQYRIWVLLGLLALTAAMGAGLPKLEVNNANELWFVPGDDTLGRYEAFREMFGSDEFAFILMETDQVFSKQGLADLEALAAMAEAMTYKGEPAIEEVVHIGNVHYIHGTEDTIEVIELANGLERDAAGLLEIRRRAFAAPGYEGLLVSRDGKAAGLLLRLQALPDDDQYHLAITRQLRAGLAQPRFAHLRLSLAGGPIMDADMDTSTIRESVLFGILALVLNILVMALLFRRWAGVAVPVTAVAMTLTWTFGLMGHLGATVNLVHVILPPLLIAVSISHAIHLLGELQSEKRRYPDDAAAALRTTVAHVGIAALLTSLTTAAGMASLMLAPVPPIRSLGFYAAIGVLLAYVATMLLVPSVLSLPWAKIRAATAKGSAGKRGDLWSRLLTRLSAFAIRRARPILVISALLIVAAAVGASRVRVETDFIAAFKANTPIRRAFDRVDGRLGGTSSIQLLVDTGRAGGAKDPELLRNLSTLQTWIETHHDKVVGTLSVADLVKNTNQVLAGGDPTAYTIPDSRAAVAQELLLYENSDPDGLFELVTDDYQILRVDIRARSSNTQMASNMMASTQEKAAALFGPKVTIRFTGVSHLFVRMAENLSRGQLLSYGAAFFLILFMMIAVVRNLPLGLWSMIPNVLPILFTLGLMGFLGLDLDFVTLLIACVAIGIAVDDTIHFLVRFRRCFATTGDVATAITESLTTAGRAMLFTTLILCAGFSIFLAGSMQSLAIFGSLVALTIAIALFADLLVMPAIMVVFRPLAVRKAPSTAQPVPRAPKGVSSFG